MNTKMTLAARAELAEAIRRRYLCASGAKKRKILDEFVAATGYHEKSAIRVLNGPPRIARRRSRNRRGVVPPMRRSA